MMGNKRDNTGQPYELLVQGIFQAIHDQKEVSNIIVEHNKTLKGKTITHQIDVYWKFEQGGIPHEVVVQAKDWETTVNQGQLLQFKGVLDDLPNQPRGVFVTRTGYQQGAKDFAEAHGIILYKLDEPAKRPNTQITPLGWILYKAEFRTFKVPSQNPDEGLVDELAMGLNTTVCQPVYSNFEFQIDSPWFDKNLPDLDRSKIKLNTLPHDQVILYDQNSARAGSLDDVVRQELAIMKAEKLDRKRVEHVFSAETFLGPPCTNTIFMKIKKVAFDLEIQVSETPAHFNLPGFVKLVLRHIPSQKEQTFITRRPGN